jgi:hypothetical protein
VNNGYIKYLRTGTALVSFLHRVLQATLKSSHIGIHGVWRFPALKVAKVAADGLFWNDKKTLITICMLGRYKDFLWKKWMNGQSEFSHLDVA